MRINEFVEPKRKVNEGPVMDKAKEFGKDIATIGGARVGMDAAVDTVKKVASGQPAVTPTRQKVQILKDGKIRVTWKKAGYNASKTFPNVQAAEKYFASAVSTQKGVVANAFSKFFNKPIVQWLGKNVAKALGAIGIAFADLIITSAQVYTNQAPKEALKISAWTAGVYVIFGKPIRLATLGAFAAFKKALEMTKVLKILKWIKNLLRLGTIATGAAAATPAWILWLGTAITWIATEVIIYLGVRALVSTVLQAMEPQLQVTMHTPEVKSEAEHLADLAVIQEALKQYESGNLDLNKPAYGENKEQHRLAVEAVKQHIISLEERHNKEAEKAIKEGWDRNSVFATSMITESGELPSNMEPVAKDTSKFSGFIKHIEKKYDATKAKEVIDTADLPADQKELANKIYIEKDKEGAKELAQKIKDKKENKS